MPCVTEMVAIRCRDENCHYMCDASQAILMQPVCTATVPVARYSMRDRFLAHAQQQMQISHIEAGDDPCTHNSLARVFASQASSDWACSQESD